MFCRERDFSVTVRNGSMQLSDITTSLAQWESVRLTAGHTGIEPHCPCSSHTSGLHIATLVATMPGALRKCSLFGLVVKVSVTRAEDPGFESRLRRDFPGSSHSSDLKLTLQWLSCQAPGVIGSVLGLVGPVSVYCDWVRWKV